MRSRSRHQNQTDPGRLPDRRGCPYLSTNTRRPVHKDNGQPAAFPWKRCGLVKSFRLGKLEKKANTGNLAVKRPTAVGP